MKQCQYLSVMGTIGSGKTTAARLIAHAFHLHLVEENFGENAFLPRFYKKMNRWAFHSQTFFLMEKITQLMEIGKELRGNTVIPANPPKGGASRDPIRDRSNRISGVIQDTPIEQDVFSYAKAQHIFGNMDDAEWRLYKKIYDSFEPHLPKPDAILFLDTSIQEIEKRITSRGRGYEKKIPKTYIELLDRLNRKWVRDMKNIRIITIPTDGVNIVTSASAQKTFLDQVHQAIGN